MDKNSYLINLSESDRTDFGRIEFAVQSHEQQVFSAIWVLESRVNSGGFGSFLEYEDAALVSFSPTALQAIGADSCASIASRAVALAPFREADETAEQLDGLDSEFFQYPDNLTDLLYKYVAANPAVFGKVPVGA